MVNSTAVFEYETYETSALEYLTEHRRYKTTKEAETATTEIISPEIILSAIKEIIEKILSVIDVNMVVRAFEKSIMDNLYLLNEVKIKLEPFEEIYQEFFEVPNWIKTVEKSYPEVIKLSRKLKSDEELTRIDKWNLNEIVKASGWNKEDIIEDLKNLDVDPSEREERYWNLFEKYYQEAKDLKNKGDDLQAAEKLWGGITALIKAYAAKKGIIVEHWSRGKLDRFVANNVEEHLKEKFEDLLTYGTELHEHFYEKRLPRRKFERRWNQCVNLIEEIKNMIGT